MPARKKFQRVFMFLDFARNDNTRLRLAHIQTDTPFVGRISSLSIARQAFKTFYTCSKNIILAK